MRHLLRISRPFCVALLLGAGLSTQLFAQSSPPRNEPPRNEQWSTSSARRSFIVASRKNAANARNGCPSNAGRETPSSSTIASLHPAVSWWCRKASRKTNRSGRNRSFPVGNAAALFCVANTGYSPPRAARWIHGWMGAASNSNAGIVLEGRTFSNV